MYGADEMLVDVFCTIAKHVTREAYTEFFTNMGVPIEAITEMFESADSDHDGNIDMDEFIRFSAQMDD